MIEKVKSQKSKVKSATENSKVEDPEVVILKNQLARTLADYDNLVKRTQEDKSKWIKFATQGFIQNLLPVLDTFENAQKHLKDAGLAIAIGQFKEALKNEGLQEINSKEGDEFNPEISEVTETTEGTEENDGKIAELVMSGWKFLDGQVVRHARVKVYKKEAQKAS